MCESLAVLLSHLMTSAVNLSPLVGILHLACIFALAALFVTLLCIRVPVSVCACEGGWVKWPGTSPTQEALNIRLSHFALNMDKIYDWRSPSK